MSLAIASRPIRQWLGRLVDIAARRATPFMRLPFVRHLRAMRLRRMGPLSDGRARGTPIVRYYWAQYLGHHRADIHGRALEIGTTETIRRYGGRSLSQADALDLASHSSEVNVVADLSRADNVPSDTYDCFVNQFTMHVIYDTEAALYHSIRILKPGGSLLINFSCLDYYFARGLDMETGAPLFMYHWFTPIEVENLFRRLGLTHGEYSLEVFGNLFTRIAYQVNMAAEELTRHELAYRDPGHPLLICARIVKPAGWEAARPPYQDPWTPSSAPATWRADTGHYERPS